MFGRNKKLPAIAENDHTALTVVAAYVEALAKQDSQQMDQLRTPDYVLDFVYADAFAEHPLSQAATRQFWPAWFAGFPEMDFTVTRTIAAPTVVVVQWTFMGVQSGMLGAPIFQQPKAATGQPVRFRGVSIYDVQADKIQHETAYLDLATLLVELGVAL
ncbi:MAG: ester cyclase [Caldilineaceae bacterium]|nr:ester cyclase [Caldilineaceae bacterium]